MNIAVVLLLRTMVVLVNIEVINNTVHCMTKRKLCL